MRAVLQMAKETSGRDQFPPLFSFTLQLTLPADAVFATKDYDGVLGKWSFDANGDTSLTTMSGRQVKNGKFDDANSVTLEAPR